MRVATLAAGLHSESPVPALRRRRSTSAGFSLVEVLLAIVILGVGVAGLTGIFATVTRESADPLIRKQALAIAEGLMQEIQLKNFSNPSGGYGGADRAQFDDIKDFNAYASAGAVSIDGAAIAGLGNYNISVAVSDAALGSGALAIPAGSAVLITVTVSYPGGTVALSSYRTAYAPDA